MAKKKSPAELVDGLDRVEADLLSARSMLQMAKKDLSTVNEMAEGYARIHVKVEKMHEMIKEVQKAFTAKAVEDKKGVRANTTEGRLVTSVKRIAKKHGLVITFKESYIDLTDGIIHVEIAKDAGYQQSIGLDNFTYDVGAKINEITGKVFKLTISNPNASEDIHTLWFQHYPKENSASNLAKADKEGLMAANYRLATEKGKLCPWCSYFHLVVGLKMCNNFNVKVQSDHVCDKFVDSGFKTKIGGRGSAGDKSGSEFGATWLR